MNFDNANKMLDRLEKAVTNPSQPVTAAVVVGLMHNYVVSILREIVIRSEEVAEVAGGANDLAQTAFVTARATLAGEIFGDISDVALALRAQVALMNVPADHAIMDLLDRLDMNVITYQEHLGEDEEDEEEAEPVVIEAVIEPEVEALEPVA